MKVLAQLRGVLRRRIVDVVRRLPDGVVLELLGSLALHRRMDYAGSDLFLDVESPEEYFLRLSSCRKEPETVKWIEESVREGDVFYDIGANVGAYTLIASRIAHGGAKVYAFEPGFANFAKLCQNVLLNRANENVIPLPVALSDETAFTPLLFNPRPGFTGRLGSDSTDMDVDDGNIEQLNMQQMVATWRLDELICALGMEPPHLIKIDVDGAELSVLRGARETLRNPSLRAVQVELESDEDVPNYAAVVKELQGAGFSLEAKFAHSVYANYHFVRNGSRKS